MGLEKKMIALSLFYRIETENYVTQADSKKFIVKTDSSHSGLRYYYPHPNTIKQSFILTEGCTLT